MRCPAVHLAPLSGLRYEDFGNLNFYMTANHLPVITISFTEAVSDEAVVSGELSSVSE